MINDEGIAACVASQDPHRLKISSRLISLQFSFYGHCFHLVNIAESRGLHWSLAPDWSSLRNRPSPSSAALPEVYLDLATTINKVQITLTRTSTVKPIRIRCSGVRGFQFIFGCCPYATSGASISPFASATFIGLATSLRENWLRNSSTASGVGQALAVLAIPELVAKEAVAAEEEQELSRWVL